MGEKRKLIPLVKVLLKYLIGNRCEICGAPCELQIHHIVPFRETADDSVGNLRVLCPLCHAIEDGRQMTVRHYLEMFRPTQFNEVMTMIAMGA